MAAIWARHCALGLTAGRRPKRCRAARSFAPDLIVLDVMLPDSDGFELFGALRRQGRTPIIMLTARGERADKVRGLSLGADDYITRPFDLEEFLARVRNVLRRIRPAVERLALAGKTQSSFGGGAGHFPGQFDQPHGIAADSKGNVYVAENRGKRIQKFKIVGS